MVVKNHRVIHGIHFLAPIEPWPMIKVVLTNLDGNPINKSDTTLKLQDVLHRGSLVFNSRPYNLVTYGFLNARCNKKFIITYCILVLVPHASYMTTLSCFKNMMNCSKRCFAFNLVGHIVIMWTSSMNLAWAWMVGIINVTSSSNSNLESWINLKLFAMCQAHFKPSYPNWPIAQH